MDRRTQFVRLGGGSGVVLPVRIEGKGSVTKNLPGKFIADVLDHFGVEAVNRQQHKAWLIVQLLGVRERQPFDSSLRTALCTEIKDHFRGNAGDFIWLKNRLHQFCCELQAKVNHGQEEASRNGGRRAG